MSPPLAWFPWVCCYGGAILALLTLEQLAFERTHPILCIFPHNVLTDTSTVQQAALAWWGSLLWITPVHCVVTGVGLHFGSKLLPRSIWRMALQANLFIHVTILHILSRITAMPWTAPFTFTWHTPHSPSATCLLANPFRFILPSFLLIAFQSTCLIAVLVSSVRV